MKIFVDDSTIINARKRTEPLIKNDIVAVSKWFECSKLTIFTDKCEAMCFGCGKLYNLSVLSTAFGFEILCKFLGVRTDKSLRFREYFDHVVKKHFLRFHI